MALHISTHPLVQHKMTLLRDQRTDPKKFRELLREIAVLITCEATSDLEAEETTVMTPLGQAQGHRLKERVGLVPILRAGLGMVEGIWNMMPNAEVWHIGLLRDEQTLEPVEYYNRLPVSPTVDVCLVLDPMLATGGSAIAGVNMLKRWGAKRIKFVGVIAAAEGARRLTTAHPDVPLYLAAVDKQLNEMGLIVPGLGDAGDRLFGTG
ncbi:MAG: uracil phosphoribosyltransferase [Anaerolineaceae bacterium 4572_32.2]|nr:MAG: uracil phosphoribosyltransferase [Anaerolineaceae bacterium 4572_32.2]